MNIVKSRINAVIKRMYDKNVLVIGCVGMGENDVYGGKDFHLASVNAIANKTIGLDNNFQGVNFLNKKGFHVVHASADEPFNMKEIFDFVLAEEVIEHLSNLGVFLENCHAHMGKNSKLIISSPNPFSFELVLPKLLFDEERTNNFHTHWQSEKTMRYLLNSHGFEVEEVIYVESEAENTIGRLYQLLCVWFPAKWARNVFYICKIKR